MKNNKGNSKLNNESQMDNLDLSIVGEVRGEEAYNMLVSMSSGELIINHRKVLTQSIEKAGIFSETEKENMLKILNELKKYSSINPEDK